MRINHFDFGQSFPNINKITPENASRAAENCSKEGIIPKNIAWKAVVKKQPVQIIAMVGPARPFTEQFYPINH